MLRDELVGRRLLLHFDSVGRRRRRLQVGPLLGNDNNNDNDKRLGLTAKADQPDQ